VTNNPAATLNTYPACAGVTSYRDSLKKIPEEMSNVAKEMLKVVKR
jgi:hypothetical protein